MPTTGQEDTAGDVLSGHDVGPRVMRGGVQRTAGFVAVNLITAIGAVLVLRHLGVEDFGRYGTVLALLAVVQGISDAGLSMTGSRELSVRKDEAERRELLGHLLALRIVLTGAGVLFAVAFAIAAGYGSRLVEGTALAGAGIFILSVQAAMLLPLVVELRNGRLTLNELLRSLVLVLCFVGLVVADAPLTAFFAAQLVAGAIVLAATPLLLERHRLVAPRWTRERLRALAVTALPLAVSSLLSVLYFRILVVLMSVFEDSAREIGYFVTSSRITEIFLALPVTLVGIVLPVLSVAARDDAARLHFVTVRMTQVLGLLGTLFALVLSVGAEPIVVLLGGEDYAGAAPVLQIQCLALVTIFIVGAWTTTLVGMERTRALAGATGVGVVAVAGLGAALIPPFGATGGAVAAVLGDLIFCAYVYVTLRRAGPGRELTAAPFVRLALAAAPSVAFALLSPLPELAEAAIVGVAFPLCALATGAVPEEIRDRVLRRV